jgi:hypothetical protein
MAELLDRQGRNNLGHDHIAVTHDNELHSRLGAKMLPDIFRNDDLPI